jgi:hypothetical protein
MEIEDYFIREEEQITLEKNVEVKEITSDIISQWAFEIAQNAFKESDSSDGA